VALPVAGHRPVGRLGGPLADHHLVADEALAAATGTRPGHAQRPARAQARGQLALECAAALDIKRLVDRLGRDPHRVSIGEVQAQPIGDLLRAPRVRPAPVPAATTTPADPRDLRPSHGDAVGALHAASQPILHIATQPIVDRQLGRLGALSTLIGMPLRCRRPVIQAAAARRGVAPQLPRDRRR
jgi:hypothetical protein